MSGVKFGLLGCTSAALLAACGSTSIPTAPSSSPGGFNVPTATATSSTVTHTAAVPSTALSGAWSGKYSGAYTGTFTLNCTESGQVLTGSIQLSNPAQTSNIDGLLKAGTITFAAAGSVVFTFTGTYTGTSMSGQYHVGASGTGSWSATKS